MDYGTYGPGSVKTRFRVLSPPYARTPSKTALPTAPTQHKPTGRTGSAPDAPVACCACTAVDDGLVDFGLFSCTSRLAAWQEPIETGVQQLPAALSRGRSSLARAQLAEGRRPPPRPQSPW
eukprot:scaffold22412_cov88-Phaeocystis_antarctica.AAC.1